ncbi:MAG: transglycosylase domain-containing protein [Thermoanaerobaculia bacterium]
MTRSRFAIAILIGFLLVAGLIAGASGWYGYRVWTELAPGSWRTPTTILAHDGEVFMEVYGVEWRQTDPIVLEELPEHIPNAFLAAEDVRFRSHPGIDPLGVARAALANVRKGGVAQGGSTITQQLAKTRFLTTERTFSRKASEALYALHIELRLSKDDILEAYLNDVYLGHRKGTTVVGLDEASQVYFGKGAADLTVAEVALLAGMIRAPNRDNPEENPDVAKTRRDAVIATMLDREWIDQAAHDEAIEAPVRFRRGSLPTRPHPWYVAALRTELGEKIGSRRMGSGGLKIHAAVDPVMQAAAEEAVKSGVERLRSRRRWLRSGEEPLQAALLSIEPATGGVRALVGGVDYAQSQYDRTRRMKRQPGSAIKPFAYAAALAGGKITAATILVDQPIEIELSRNDIWKPHNYDEEFRGEVTVREAFEKSLNVPLVRLVDDMGPRAVRNVLSDARVGKDFSDTPAIALGVDEVGMSDLLGAYSAFPNLGFRVEPHLVESVETSSGRTIYRHRAKPRKVIEPAVAYVIHSLMRGVVERGTAASLSRQGLGYVAGKTGTTNDYRDAWFVGYTPDLLTASWVGFDDGTPLRISSAEAALPIWSSYMSRAPHQKATIDPPEGVVLVDIGRATGGLWAPGCGERFREAFLVGSEPTEPCRPRAVAPPMYAEFEEPAVISAEKFREWMQGAPGVQPIEIVIEPGSGDLDDDPDVLDERERREIDRQLEDALRQSPPEPSPAPGTGTPPVAVPPVEPPTIEPPQPAQPGEEIRPPDGAKGKGPPRVRPGRPPGDERGRPERPDDGR